MRQEITSAAKKLYPVDGVNFKSLKSLIFRARFLRRAKQQQPLLDEFVTSLEALGYAHILEQYPYMLGLVEWPYIHNKWTVQQRVHSILGHYELLHTKPKFLDVSDAQAKVIVDLSEYSEGASIVVDRAKWFAREGEVVLNLFKGDKRVKSIAFSLGQVNNELVIYVGAIQGIHADDDTLGLFKSLTKEFEGLRPRSLVIEMLRNIAEKVGAKRIWAISDENRHHRHPYFADTHKFDLKSQYDSIWLDHGGVKLDNGFFEIPVAKHRKEITEVSSNKRAMYRRRYTMLENLEQAFSKLQCFVFTSLLAEVVFEVLAGLTFFYSTVDNLNAFI
ncbi:MAG TPA: DUF535 family protein [Methylophilaceae bacterium]